MWDSLFVWQFIHGGFTLLVLLTDLLMVPSEQGHCYCISYYLISRYLINIINAQVFRQIICLLYGHGEAQNKIYNVLFQKQGFTRVFSILVLKEQNCALNKFGDKLIVYRILNTWLCKHSKRIWSILYALQYFTNIRPLLLYLLILKIAMSLVFLEQY